LAGYFLSASSHGQDQLGPGQIPCIVLALFLIVQELDHVSGACLVLHTDIVGALAVAPGEDEFSVGVGLSQLCTGLVVPFCLVVYAQVKALELLELTAFTQICTEIPDEFVTVAFLEVKGFVRLS